MLNRMRCEDKCDWITFGCPTSSRRLQTDGDGVIQVSFVVRNRSDCGWNRFLVAAAELRAPNKLKLFQSVFFFLEEFMEMKGKPALKLSASRRLCDLAFMVDIKESLSELNLKLQHPIRPLSSLLSHVKSIEVKLKLWQVQLERGKAEPLPALPEQKLWRLNVLVSVQNSIRRSARGSRTVV